MLSKSGISPRRCWMYARVLTYAVWLILLGALLWSFHSPLQLEVSSRFQIAWISLEVCNGHFAGMIIEMPVRRHLGPDDGYDPVGMMREIWKSWPSHLKFSGRSIHIRKPSMVASGRPLLVTTCVYPLWLLFLGISAICLLMITTRQLRRRTKTATTCTCCEYDLVGNESGVCPECGTPIPEERRQTIADAGRLSNK